jgi:hypothetical protein
MAKSIAPVLLACIFPLRELKMTKAQINKQAPQRDFIRENSDYFRIDSAAHDLGCTPEELLHLGAIGKLELTAPVLNSGSYSWPNDSIAWVAFPELKEQCTRYFGGQDRVILGQKALALIEARGWVIPNSFADPKAAKQCIENIRLYLGKESEFEPDFETVLASLPEDVRKVAEEQKREGKYSARFYKIDTYTPPPLPEYLKHLDPESFLYSPWIALETLEAEDRLNQLILDAEEKNLQPTSDAEEIIVQLTSDAEKTTIQHLFISKDEFNRLWRCQPQDKAQEEQSKHTNALGKQRLHGNVEANATKRVQILKAAIYCYLLAPAKCPTNRAWANYIDEKASLFWPDKGEPPLSIDTIERLIGEAKKTPDEK